ncbi:MAG: hypothetical protein IPN39_12735 [Chitinophagaceae bacterium]|nr:hypothetical protein [Chitinophagaceae bacterium]
MKYIVLLIAVLSVINSSCKKDNVDDRVDESARDTLTVTGQWAAPTFTVPAGRISPLLLVWCIMVTVPFGRKTQRPVMELRY